MTPKDEWLSIAQDFWSSLAVPEPSIGVVVRDAQARAGQLLWTFIDSGTLPSLQFLKMHRKETWDSDDEDADMPSRWACLWVLACLNAPEKIPGFPQEPIPSQVRSQYSGRYIIASNHQMTRFYARACEWFADNLTLPYLDLDVDRKNRVLQRKGHITRVEFRKKDVPWKMFLAMFEAGERGLTNPEMQKMLVQTEWDSRTTHKNVLKDQLLKAIGVTLKQGEWLLIDDGTNRS